MTPIAPFPDPHFFFLSLTSGTKIFGSIGGFLSLQTGIGDGESRALKASAGLAFGSFGEPEFGEPEFGEPEFGEPEFGEPEFGEPEFGELEPGEPEFGEPEFGELEPGEPEFGEPAFGEPEPGEPEFGELEPGEPEFGEPEFGEPEPGEPAPDGNSSDCSGIRQTIFSCGRCIILLCGFCGSFGFSYTKVEPASLNISCLFLSTGAYS